VVALDPATGALRWHYQFAPHDSHDWDACEPIALVDTTLRGEPRKLLAQANRNGFFYAVDRVTGKLLGAEPFVKQITWASGIGADGRPQLLRNNEPTTEGQLICPSVSGAANWRRRRTIRAPGCTTSWAWNPATSTPKGSLRRGRAAKRISRA
jgi:alcohol dehydrogenase (cytochrome c)